MLTYSFTAESEQSLYEQLYRYIKEDIALGRLQAHEKLPSKRSFAKHLGLSNTTVENAYAQLVTEGYLYALPKRGYFVSPLETSTAEEEAPAPTPSYMPEDTGDYVADLLFNGVPSTQFPFSIWMKLMRQVMISESENDLLTARPAEGLPELRQAIAEHLRDFRGMNVEPSQIIVGAGTEYLYAVLIQLLGRKAIYGVEDPGYLRLSWIYERNDVTCRHISMDKAGIRPQELEDSGTEILHITPSHHFPTGLVMPISRRYELLAWASRDEGRYIIEDDYDCEFRLSGKPIPTLQSIDTIEKVIYLNTFSQSLAPAFRISYLVLPPHLTQRFQEHLGFYSGTVSCFEQYTLARFLHEGYFEKHINRMRTYYRHLRDEFLRALGRSPLSSIAEIQSEDNGVHFLMKVKTPFSDAQIRSRAKQEGLRLTCMSEYFYEGGDAHSATLVINYAGIPVAQIPKVVACLCACVLDKTQNELPS